MVIIGGIWFLTSLVQVIFISPPSPYMGGIETEIRMRQEQMGSDMSKEEIREQIEAERKQMAAQERYWRMQRLIDAVIMMVVAAPVYFYHWRKVQRETQEKKAQLTQS
jgi:hypothetical protein